MCLCHFQKYFYSTVKFYCEISQNILVHYVTAEIAINSMAYATSDIHISSFCLCPVAEWLACRQSDINAPVEQFRNLWQVNVHGTCGMPQFDTLYNKILSRVRVWIKILLLSTIQKYQQGITTVAPHDYLEILTTHYSTITMLFCFRHPIRPLQNLRQAWLPPWVLPEVSINIHQTIRNSRLFWSLGHNCNCMCVKDGIKLSLHISETGGERWLSTEKGQSKQTRSTAQFGLLLKIFREDLEGSSAVEEGMPFKWFRYNGIYFFKLFVPNATSQFKMI